MSTVLHLFSAKLFGSLKHRKIILGVFLAIVSNTSLAWDVILGKVVFVEPSYLPEKITFAMTTGSNLCPAGTSLKWSKSDPEYQNNLAVYETLKTAVTFDKNIEVYLYPDDPSCEAQFLHLLNK